MERTMSVEEKIRRAEEIYERRRQGENKPIPVSHVREDKKNKKDIKLLRKMMIQIIVCVCIYLMIYTVQNSNYVFSKDFINRVNQLLSYDTNFMELYENGKNQIMNLFQPNQPKEEITPPAEEGIGGAIENTEQGENVDNTTQNNEMNETNETKALSQAEQDILAVKNTTSFIKPIQGTISSPYGRRENATGTVPKNHTGTDIAANMGTVIKSATDGEVVLSSEEGDYGKHLKIQIGEVSIIYAHCSKLYVNQGDKITQGQEIAEVGSTGNSTRTTFTF